MKFSSEHLTAIQDYVDQSPISRLEMRDNIIDHLACAVEYRLLNGVNFEQALNESISDFAPNGLGEIELETHLLLNFKSITTKKIIYSIGLFFSVSATIGILFRLLMGLKAPEFVRLFQLVGFGGLALIFIPSLFLLQQQKNLTRQEKIRLRTLLISLILFSLGWVGKYFHLATSNEMILLGSAVFALGFLPLMFHKLYKEAIAPESF